MRPEVFYSIANVLVAKSIKRTDFPYEPIHRQFLANSYFVMLMTVVVLVEWPMLNSTMMAD
jgi:hypothetical protein